MTQQKFEADRTYHLQVRTGATVVYQGQAFGDRATLQVPGRDIDQDLLAYCDIVEPDQVPDVGTRPEPPRVPVSTTSIK